MTAPASPWGRCSGRDPEKEAAKLERRFGDVSRRSFGRRPPRWTRNLDWPLIVMVLVIASVVAFTGWRWVWTSNMRAANQAILQTTHVRDCDHARRLGVTPLYSGYPGYRESLDRDRDGIACEPYPI